MNETAIIYLQGTTNLQNKQMYKQQRLTHMYRLPRNVFQVTKAMENLLQTDAIDANAWDSRSCKEIFP